MSLTQQLKEPFDYFDIEWRVQQAGKTKTGKLWAIIIPYITNRAIQERLDEVCKVEGWKNEFTYPTEKSVICGISIKLDDGWLTKWDGSEETDIEAVKGGLSSAMKRAAVQWGIGRYLYKLDSVIITPQTDKPQTMEDFIMAYVKIEGRKERIYYNRPTLPKWALPTTTTESLD